MQGESTLGTPRRRPRPSRPGGDVCCGCLGRGRCEAHSGTSAVDASMTLGRTRKSSCVGRSPGSGDLWSSPAGPWVLCGPGAPGESRGARLSAQEGRARPVSAGLKMYRSPPAMAAGTALSTPVMGDQTVHPQYGHAQRQPTRIRLLARGLPTARKDPLLLAPRRPTTAGSGWMDVPTEPNC